MVQSEKRLLWHPRGNNKFIVGGGSQITLYEWAQEHPGIRQVSSQHDLQHLKCFAWSPDPSFDDLVAVGNSSGKIELLRLEASKNPQRSNALSSGQGIALMVRNSRSCNSLAFCNADPNYLATASAMLSVPLGQSANHDILKRPPRPQPIIPQADVGRGADNRVLQQHAPTETVSTVCFLPQSTHQLLAGISHRWLRFFDLRSPLPSTTNVSCKVQGITTDPFDPHRIACFGDGTISVWDSRKLQVPILAFTEKDASADGAYLRPNSAFVGIEFSSTRRGTLASLERDASYVRFWDIMDAQARTHDGSPWDGNKARDLGKGGRKPWANLPWPSGSSGHHQAQPYPKNQETLPSAVLFDTRRTKAFDRPLASFALAPSPTQHPLTSNVMVVNKEGDLELYAVHDTPKPTAWSSRGDLALAAGLSCRIIAGALANEGEVTHPGSSLSGLATGTIPNTGSGSRSREGSILRGRPKTGPVVPPPPQLPNKQAPYFGRGDEDGFPALGSAASARNVGVDHAVNGMTKKGQEDALDVSSGRAASLTRSTSRPRRAGGAKGGAKVVTLIVENDVSMVMRRRALRGYGLSEPQNNMEIVRECDPPHHGSQMLRDLWAWIFHSHEYLCVPKSVIHGFDFAYQGLLGIWEGFQSLPVPESPDLLPPTSYFDIPVYHDRRRVHGPLDELRGNFQAALTALAARRAGDRPWKPTVPTIKGLQRQIALQLIGWSLREDELAATLHRWERDGELSRAACWLVFTKQYSKAIALLMKSSDESHCMLSGTVAALAPHGSRSTELREHCERLIVRLQDPYFRAMLTHLALNDWSEVLEEEALPFRERLAIAFQFLDDKAVTSYLRRCMDRSLSRGDIDGIIVPGLSSKAGLDILQGYVDRTGDIQSAAILGSYVCPPRNVTNLRRISGSERRVERWVEGYRDLLDGFKMFHHRVGFDIERGQVALGERAGMITGASAVGDWVPRQIIIRCYYCNKSVVPDGPGGGIAAEVGGMQHPGRSTAYTAREAELLHSQSQDPLDDAIVMCQTCRHGGHVAHILDWFYGEDGGPAHDVCAIFDIGIAVAIYYLANASNNRRIRRSELCMSTTKATCVAQGAAGDCPGYRHDDDASYLSDQTMISGLHLRISFLRALYKLDAKSVLTVHLPCSAAFHHVVYLLLDSTSAQAASYLILHTPSAEREFITIPTSCAMRFTIMLLAIPLFSTIVSALPRRQFYELWERDFAEAVVLDLVRRGGQGAAASAAMAMASKAHDLARKQKQLQEQQQRLAHGMSSSYGATNRKVAAAFHRR
ncbi:putative WD40 repeats [Lyophyllum shimeji]|uniref:WD40 repeats n=1 Tax=Lyophyllum shimeji TaxID=47721 RepID=A0A9P3Q0P9_LYOSH|nr:putative WD40 repeats [Lyophyllum shimeji]